MYKNMLETIFSYRGATQIDRFPALFSFPEYLESPFHGALSAVSQLYAALCNFLQSYSSFSTVL